jgi:tRNA(Ile)-lysidine synthetase-like protein
MEIDLQPGKYVVAVSGGVDSMVLLDLLRQMSGLELVVAHFDHGIRDDSAADRIFVDATAKSYGLLYSFAEGNLGPKVSEATARQARYDFLHRVKSENEADAIITAHHQDDMLETAIINLLRGTGRKGLSSLRSTDDIKRPLLNIPKSEIQKYAKKHKLEWREDSTNQDESYLRNYVRHRLLPHLSETEKNRLLQIINQAAETNEQLDHELLQLLPVDAGNLSRKDIIALSHAEARELMAAWLRSNHLRDFDRSTLERMVVAAKTGRPGKQIDVFKKVTMRIGRSDLALEHIER